MKIEFLLPNEEVISSPYDHASLRKSNAFHFYLRLKSLEFDKHFLQIVRAFRETARIPENGLSKSEALKLNKSEEPPDVIKLKTGEIIEYGKLYGSDYSRKVFKLDDLHEMEQYNKTALADIITFGFVRIKEDINPIIWYKDSNKGFVVIQIQANVSKTKFLNYIDKVYSNEIQPELEKLKSKDRFHLSKRDLEILSLRKYEDLTFKEISEKLPYGMTDTEVRIAYYRAMKRIKSRSGVIRTDTLNHQERIDFFRNNK